MTNLEQWERSYAELLKDVPPALELRVTLQNLVNVNLDHALNLSIVLADEHLYPWFYESYVQLFSVRVLRRQIAGFVEIVSENDRRGDETENIEVNFVANPGSRWLNECHVKMFLGSEPDDIISFIIRSINLGCYLRVQVDENYLPGKRSYGRRQFIHPAMVYGYDNESRQLKVMGFDAKGFFTKLTFSYDDFMQAYESARRLNPDTAVSRGLVLLVRPKKPRDKGSPYPFSVAMFLTQLNNYLSSRIESSLKFDLTAFFPQGSDVDARFRCGHSVYEHFGMGLEEIARGNTETMDYKSMHTLFEHKRFLRAAFGFIMSEHRIEGRLDQLVKDFENVSQEFHSMRWKFIRFNFTRDTKLITQIIEQFNTVKDKEHQLLRQIHDQLQEDCRLLLD